MKRDKIVESVIAIVFIVIGVVLRVSMGREWCDKWMLDMLFITAGVCYFVTIPIDRYYKKKAERKKQKEQEQVE